MGALMAVRLQLLETNGNALISIYFGEINCSQNGDRVRRSLPALCAKNTKSTPIQSSQLEQSLRTSRGLFQRQVLGSIRDVDVLWWTALFLLHSVCIAYYAIVTSFYHAFLPGSNLAYQLQTYSIGIYYTQYSNVAKAHAVVCACHGVYLLLMVLGSVQQRQLAFYPRRWLSWADINVLRVASQDMLPPQHLLTKLSEGASQSLSRVGTAVFGRSGIMGPDFAYFDHVLLVREVLETGLQTYEAYRMTQLLPRLWLNRIYVGLLVVNCWSIPILHRVYHHHHRMRRLMSLLCDAVLDVLSSMGVSFLIYLTYAPQYTDPDFGFPFNNWFDEIWFTSVYQEFQMMLIVSWGDMASRLVFAFGVLQCTRSIKNMLLDTRSHSKDSNVVPSDLVNEVNSLRPVGPNSAFCHHGQSPRRNKQRLGRVDFVLSVVGPGLFCVWGIAILATHIYAETRLHFESVCRLPLRPWFNQQSACSLVDVDCSEFGVSLESGDQWTRFDPHLAAGIHIRHCDDLTVPPVMESFTRAVFVKVYNSTIQSWSEEAGLTATSHGRLRIVYLIRVNLRDGLLPPGLVSDQFPQTFRSFYACKTNLIALPDYLDRVWPHEMLIAIEYGLFTAIPDVFIRLQPNTVSFAYTPIASVPPELFEIPNVGELILVGTRLRELPHNVSRLGNRLYLLFIGGTNVSTFWAWMDPIIPRAMAFNSHFFDAHGTPYCNERDRIVKGLQTGFSTYVPGAGQASVMDVSTPERLTFAEAAVSCVLPDMPMFPIEQEDANSALNSADSNVVSRR